MDEAVECFLEVEQRPQSADYNPRLRRAFVTLYLRIEGGLEAAVREACELVDHDVLAVRYQLRSNTTSPCRWERSGQSKISSQNTGCHTVL